MYCVLAPKGFLSFAGQESRVHVNGLCRLGVDRVQSIESGKAEATKGASHQAALQQYRYENGIGVPTPQRSIYLPV